MLLPEKPRVLYGRNPLEQVICQLRFPAILRIAAEAPARFQESIRERFPVFKERREVDALPTELRSLVPAEMLGSSSDVTYDFVSEDGSLTVTLSKDFLALTAHRYGRWEQFRETLSNVWDAVQHEYRPAFIVRTGLRYPIRESTPPLRLTAHFGKAKSCQT